MNQMLDERKECLPRWRNCRVVAGHCGQRLAALPAPRQLDAVHRSTSAAAHPVQCQRKAWLDVLDKFKGPQHAVEAQHREEVPARGGGREGCLARHVAAAAVQPAALQNEQPKLLSSSSATLPRPHPNMQAISPAAALA